MKPKAEKLSKRILASIKFWRQSAEDLKKNPTQDNSDEMVLAWETRASVLEELLPEVKETEDELNRFKRSLKYVPIYYVERYQMRFGRVSDFKVGEIVEGNPEGDWIKIHRIGKPGIDATIREGDWNDWSPGFKRGK